MIFGIDFSRLFHKDLGSSGSFGGGLTLAESNATFNALAKVENATYFITGQSQKDTSMFLPFYYNECAIVHGRAVTIQSTK